MLKIHQGTQKIRRNEIAYHFGIALIKQHFWDSNTLISSFKISVIETKFVQIQQKKKKEKIEPERSVLYDIIVFGQRRQMPSE